jgi:uncharacterized RDD family membrane protein YckC
MLYSERDVHHTEGVWAQVRSALLLWAYLEGSMSFESGSATSMRTSTPTDPIASLEPASRRLRLGAFVIDSLMAGCVVLSWFIACAMAGGGESEIVVSSSGIGSSLRSALFLQAILATIVYIAINCRGLAHTGQSPGKRLLGLRIVRRSGEAAGGARLALVRFLFVGLVANLLPIIQLVNAIWILGPSKRCLHDILTDTIVVRAS